MAYANPYNPNAPDRAGDQKYFSTFTEQTFITEKTSYKNQFNMDLPSSKHHYSILEYWHNHYYPPVTNLTVPVAKIVLSYINSKKDIFIPRLLKKRRKTYN